MLNADDRDSLRRAAIALRDYGLPTERIVNRLRYALIVRPDERPEVESLVRAALEPPPSGVHAP